jgi:serine/threonine protein kinase
MAHPQVEPGRYRLTGRGSGDERQQVGAVAGGRMPYSIARDVHQQREVVITRVPMPEVVTGTLLADEWARHVGPRGPRALPGVPEDRPPAAAVVVGAPGTTGWRALNAARAVIGAPAHRSLVRVHDVFLEEGSLQVVSELVADAVPLAVLLDAEGPLSSYRAAEIAADLLAALEVLHASGRSHRNIGPWTVLICADGTAMLGGSAEGAAQDAVCGNGGVTVDQAGEDGERGNGVGAGSGKDEPAAPPRWGVVELRDREARMAEVGPCAERWSPEQAGPPITGGVPERSAAGAPEQYGPWPAPVVGAGTDIWALGALLFRAVHCRPPYPEDDVETLLRAVREGPEWTAVRPGPQDAAPCRAIPTAGRSGRLRQDPPRRDPLRRLRPIVAAMLVTDPAERPTARSVRARLDELIAGAPQPDPEETGEVGTLLPVLRPPGTVEPHRGRGRHARAGSAGRRSEAPKGRAAQGPAGRQNGTGRGGSASEGAGAGRTEAGRTVVGRTEAGRAGEGRSGGRRRGLLLGISLVVALLALVIGALLVAVLLLPEG